MGSKSTGSRLTMPAQQTGNVPNMMGGGFGAGIEASVNRGDRQPEPGGNPLGALSNLTGGNFAIPGMSAPQAQPFTQAPQGPAQNPMGQMYGAPAPQARPDYSQLYGIPQPTLNGQPMPTGAPQQGFSGGGMDTLLQGLRQRRDAGSLQGQSAILSRALNRRR